jgi:hypothetical protein
MIIRKFADGRMWWRISGERGWYGGMRPDWSEVPEVFEPVCDTSVTA